MMRSHFYLFSLVIYFLSCLFNSSLGTDVNDTFLEDSSEESLQFQKLIEFVHNNSAFHIIERFFNLLSEPDFEKVINSTDVSQLCYNDLRLIGNGISTGESWALRLIDTYGKPGSGLQSYQIQWLGSYDECMGIRQTFQSSGPTKPDPLSFSGKYCKLSFILTGTKIRLSTIDIAITPAVKLGTCVPDTCSPSDIEEILNATGILQSKDIRVAKVKAVCQEDNSLETSAIVAICILSVLGLIIFVATLYDVIPSQLKHSSGSSVPTSGSDVTDDTAAINGGFLNDVYDASIDYIDGENASVISLDGKLSSTSTGNGVPGEKSKVTKDEKVSKGLLETLLLAFSLYTNAKKLLAIPDSHDNLRAINGIKFLSMSWVILGHNYLFILHYTDNAYSYLLDEGNTWPFMAMSQAGFAVDTFLAVSALLVAYLTFIELKKADGIRNFNWIIFFFHRIWRLTPTYMLVLMVYTTLMKYGSTGPYWTENEVIFDDCKESWWTNLLYVNNFVKLDKMCMGWTWYLANDMQLYVLSPLILIPLFYQEIVGGVVCFLFLLGAAISTAVIVMENDFHAQTAFKAVPWLLAGGHLYGKQLFTWLSLVVSLMAYFVLSFFPLDVLDEIWDLIEGEGDYTKKVYLPFYTRMGPYVAGIFTGYLLYRLNLKCRIPKILVLLGWVVSILICIAVVYGPYEAYGNHIINDEQSTAYEALHRTGWGIAICWIIFACATGNGGWINAVLSWKPIIPLGRLTYCAYLIHPMVILTYYMSRRRPIYMSHYDIVYLFLPNHVLSYGVAYLVSLVFESPMMAIEKALLRREKHR